MEVQFDSLKERLIEKIGEILLKVKNLHDMVESEVDNQKIISETGVLRSCLNELEELVFERYSRECLLASSTNDIDSGLLLVLNRLFK